MESYILNRVNTWLEYKQTCTFLLLFKSSIYVVRILLEASILDPFVKITMEDNLHQSGNCQHLITFHLYMTKKSHITLESETESLISCTHMHTHTHLQIYTHKNTQTSRHKHIYIHTKHTDTHRDTYMHSDAHI